MEKLTVLFTLCLIFPTLVRTQCSPSDEFEEDTEDSVAVTEEFENLMEKFNELTFKTYNLPCTKNKSSQVVIDEKSDFLWDLRFNIYNKRENQQEKTIVQCFEENQTPTCDVEALRTCLKSARIAMWNDINSTWTSKVDEQLARMANEC